mmetsp:Transcript_18291/g.36898  ORF Transcript_18291/g.36898 Transcript_18291/m.36898 type:complete len:213 (+) Transcript_18291:937-1575(+)
MRLLSSFISRIFCRYPSRTSLVSFSLTSPSSLIRFISLTISSRRFCNDLASVAMSEMMPRNFSFFLISRDSRASAWSFRFFLRVAFSSTSFDTSFSCKSRSFSLSPSSKADIFWFKSSTCRFCISSASSILAFCFFSDFTVPKASVWSASRFRILFFASSSSCFCWLDASKRLWQRAFKSSRTWLVAAAAASLSAEACSANVRARSLSASRV